METTKKTTSKKKLIDDNAIISKYIDDVLEKNEEPKNVFSFCKEHKIDETEFYTFFGSIDALKQEIWVKFSRMRYQQFKVRRHFNLIQTRINC